VTKNWPNDVRVGCKAPFTLVELINFEINLKEELDEIEISFEQKNLNDDQFLHAFPSNEVCWFFCNIKAFNYF
jgi:hypothetical protein